MIKKLLVWFMILSFLAATMGCAEWNRTKKGAAIGAGVGGAARLAASSVMPPVIRLPES
jgi:hypothetical protein